MQCEPTSNRAHALALRKKLQAPSLGCDVADPRLVLPGIDDEPFEVCERDRSDDPREIDLDRRQALFHQALLLRLIDSMRYANLYGDGTPSDMCKHIRNDGADAPFYIDAINKVVSFGCNDDWAATAKMNFDGGQNDLPPSLKNSLCSQMYGRFQPMSALNPGSVRKVVKSHAPLLCN
jgi:hypothetical protein